MATFSLASPPQASAITRSVTLHTHTIPYAEIIWQEALDRIEQRRTNLAEPDADNAQRERLLEARALAGTDSPKAAQMLERFVRDYPDSPAADPVRLLIGDCRFYDKDYTGAMQAYSAVDPAHASLSQTETERYRYRLAVSRLRCGLADEETDRLLRLLSGSPDYALEARYYRAYYDYLRRDYNRAYDGFEYVARQLQDNDADSEGMYPAYYMTQIDYIRGKYADVIRHGKTLLRRVPVSELDPEMRRTVGLACFKTGDHATARGLLEDYIAGAANAGFSPATDAVYALAVCEYEQGDTDMAERRFTGLTDLHDMIGQGAWYYLGEIAMSEHRYDEAVMAFRKAARTGFDDATAEDAAYNCIAAITHGGRSPFSSPTAMYEEFLQAWPASRHSDSVRKGLYQAYALSQDYDSALATLSRISHPDASVMAERQKLLYAKGTRLQRAGRASEAVASLREAASSGSDRTLAADASLRLGEALYDTGDYPGSVNALTNALRGSLHASSVTAARYQRGYSLLRSSRYADAASDFEAVSRDLRAPARMAADARLRLADCQYYAGDLAASARSYREARAEDGDSDGYTTLRLALLAGLEGDHASETAMLREFLRDYPESPSRAEAMLKLGNSLLAQGKTDEALSTYTTLATRQPESAYAREAALKGARLTSERKGVTAGAEAYKQIIRQWPTSEEASAANDTLRDLYASQGELEEYVAFLNAIPGAPRIAPDQMEEISFRTAERAYVADPSDIELLETFAARYPNAANLAPALLDIATSKADRGDGVGALTALDRLLSDRPDSPEAIDALLLKGQICEHQSTPDREGAYDSYARLLRLGGADFEADALTGMMRNAPDASTRRALAARVKEMRGVNGATLDQARLYEAVADLGGKNSKTAETTLQRLAANPDSEAGAQAAVELGRYYLEAGRTADATTLLEDFTSSGTPQAYWLANGFLLLADALEADGKTWLAKEYVVSLRDNYPGNEPDITEGIARRLRSYSNENTATRKSRKKR